MPSVTAHPTNITDNNAIGTLSWSSPENAGASDDSPAFVSRTPAAAAISHYLNAVGYDFSEVPDGATIDGIVVGMERTGFNTGTGVKDHTCKLVKGGVVSGDNKADTGTLWTSAVEETVTRGADDDLWGLELTADDVKAADFGFALAVTIGGDNLSDSFALVDDLPITVHYTEAAAGVDHGARLRRLLRP